MSDEELEYLSPGFDPATLTVPRIRSILVSHDVPYAASAKKSQLVETFNEKITPRAPKILAARRRIKRTSHGITDVPSSQESTVSRETEEPEPPPPPSTVKRRSKKSVRPTPGTAEEDTRAPPKTTERRRTTKHPRAEDSEVGGDAAVRPTARKTRKSEGPPAVKAEELERPPSRRKPDESPFSDDNPFQRGSSPTTAAESRRRTTGAKADKKRAESNRRKTEQPRRVKQEDGVVVPSSRTFEVPLTKAPRGSTKGDVLDPLAPGEDFTPDEQQALAEHRAAEGETALVRRQRTKRSSGTLKSAPWIIIMTLLVGYAGWWRKEKIEVGFCGVGKPAVTLRDIQAPDWAHQLQPQCEPCPLHASCYADLEVRCDPDFVRKAHPFALGGLVPLPPTCEPDGEKARKVKTVADRAVEELRDRRAMWECGELTDARGKAAPSPEVDEVTLKAEVSQRRRRAMSDEEFEELWRSAIGEVTAREEVTSNSDGNTQLLRLSSASLAKLSFGCAVRRSGRVALARYRVPLVLLTVVVGALAYLRAWFLNVRADRARVPTLVASTLDRLATQAALHAQGASSEPWISAGQMRDDVLRDEFSAARREAIWRQVREIVELNANVRASVREGRAGEVSRVWEWIGSVQRLEDGGYRRGGRHSASPPNNGRREVGDISPPVESGPGEMMERRHWDEGRPIY